VHLVSLSSASVVGRSDGFVAADVGDEVVALSIEHGTCYGFNRTGSRIWNLLATPARVGDLCATLVAEYAVDPKVCEDQVVGLLEELRTEGMITTPEVK
jgi:hypothetical protein